MCRWVVYIGTHEIHLAEIVSKPEHSIFNYQSRQAGVLLANWGMKLSTLGELLNHMQRNHNLNGDGCGLGLYLKDDLMPLVFNSLLPAWNNRNIVRLADRLHARLFFAHVRAASPGSPVSEVNTHPFQFGRLMWMHNGGIARFPAIRRKLLMQLHAKSFANITGTTDTEHAGAVFMDMLPRKSGPQSAPDTNVDYTIQELTETMERTIGNITSLVDELSSLNSPEESSSLNFAVSDGKCVIAARWRNSWWQSPPLLFYSQAGTFMALPNEHNVVLAHGVDSHANDKRSVLISSEPTNAEKGKWNVVPRNHLIVVDAEANLKLIRISVPLKRFRVASRQWLARARQRIVVKHAAKVCE